MDLDRQRIIARSLLRFGLQKMLNEGRSVEEAAQELVDEFGEDGDRLFSDNELHAFTAAMAEGLKASEPEKSAD